jgi:hypothetical protein
MFNLSDRRLSFVFSFCVVMLVCSACPAKNLLTNNNFDKAEPGSPAFGWNLELAKGQKSKLTVVKGRTGQTQAVRFYNDVRGTSSISQKFAVRPWRWYVAEVWVKTDDMYPADAGMALRGGAKIGNWQYNNDYFYAPKTGWRIIRIYDHSGNSESMTLSIGGRGDWSGDLYMSQPAVREVSLAEAIIHYPKVLKHNPLNNGLPLHFEVGKGLPGYAYLRDNVRQLAKDFPNALRITTDLPTPIDPEARISLWLPPGIRFIKLRPHAGGKKLPIVTDLSDNDGPGGTHLEMFTGRGETSLLVASDLEPGERATGYVSYEWKGGYQPPRQVEFLGVDLPKVTAPKRLITAFDMYALAYKDWDDFRPGQTGEEAMVQDLKRMGFNRIEVWGGGAKHYAEMGIEGTHSTGVAFRLDAESPDEARAVLLDGSLSKTMMCPSYRGPAFKNHYVFDYADTAGKCASAMNMDDEGFLVSGEGPRICFCDRCIEQWGQWVHKEHPKLDSNISPKKFFTRAHKYSEYYKAWLKFRCELVAERFGIVRQAFFDAVKKWGTKTTPNPEFWVFTGEEQLVALSSMESLSKVLDYISPMIYTNGDGIRKEIADYAPISGGKVVFCLASGYNISPEGDTRSQVLEAVMGGSKGFLMWNYDYGPVTTGHMAEMSEAIRMLAPVEDIILDGNTQTGYTADKDSTHLLARELDGQTVLLVSDYLGRAQVMVTVPGKKNLEVIDRFTEQVVAKLNATDRTFSVTIRPNFQARLYHLRPASCR